MAACPRRHLSILARGCFLYLLNWVISTVASGKLAVIFSSPGRGLRKAWRVVAYRSAGGSGLLPQGLKPNQNGAVTAALKRCATQNQQPRARAPAPHEIKPLPCVSTARLRAAPLQNNPLPNNPFKTTSESQAVGGGGIPRFKRRRVDTRLCTEHAHPLLPWN